MRYLSRALKYYIELLILLAVFIAGYAIYCNYTGKVFSIETMFSNGMQSVWLICGLFAAVSIFYPHFGYTSKKAIIPGEYSEIRPGVVKYMEEHGYKLETEEGENLTFRSTKPLFKAVRMFEDRITLTRAMTGFEVEGLTKDIVRIVGGLEYSVNNSEE